MDEAGDTWYDALLQALGDDLDAVLGTLLEHIGVGIKESQVRASTFQTRYGEKAAELLAEIEEFLGVAFVASQAYITAVASRLHQVHELAQLARQVVLTTTSGTKRDIMRHGFQPSSKRPYSEIEVMNAFANYYKHRDEWDPDWTRLQGNQLETATTIRSVGAFQSSTENLRTGAKYFGITDFSNTRVLGQIFADWRRQLVRDYEAELRRLHPGPS